MKKLNEYLLYEKLTDSNALFLLPHEEIVLTTRQHGFSIVAPMVIASLLGLGAIILGFIGASVIAASPILTLLCASTIVVVTLCLITKVYVDWYFHIYMVTNRRILEIVYRPFYSQDVNDVLLDQVRCTEIDIKIHGYLNSMMDVGDIIITFDRPTHQQEFVLHDIKSPRKNGTLLGHLLNTPKATINNKTVWYQSTTNKDNYTFTENLSPFSRSESMKPRQVV